MSDKKIDKPDLTALLGGKPVRVALMDGTTEDVSVRALPLSRLHEYGELQTNEARLLEVLCDKPKGWSDLVEEESIKQILAEGDRLNFTRFSQWSERQLARNQKLVEELTKRTSSPSPKSDSALPPAAPSNSPALAS
jgi:hypothetical protein